MTLPPEPGPAAPPPEPAPPPRHRDALGSDLRTVRSRPERAFNIGAALGLVLATATFIFLVQNRGATDFDWLWFDFTLPLWIALAAALVTGALLVVTALAVHARRTRRIARRDQAAARLEDALVGEQPASEPAAPRRPRRPGPMQASGH